MFVNILVVSVYFSSYLMSNVVDAACVHVLRSLAVLVSHGTCVIFFVEAITGADFDPETAINVNISVLYIVFISPQGQPTHVKTNYSNKTQRQRSLT